MHRKRITVPDGIPGSPGLPRDTVAETRPGRAALHVALELARSRGRLRHRPTIAQLRTMAALDGREPASYPLDAAVNPLPEPLPADFPHGSVGLRFAHADGELVALPNGWGFPL